MPVEIEKKFLVINDSWREQVKRSKKFMQGYLVGSKHASVRVRLQGDEAFLNIKSATLDIVRQEYEYPIPVEEAEEILQHLCEQPLITKTRHYVEHAGKTWEIDEFSGENQGLIVAEVELQSADEDIDYPGWTGKEVSDKPRYYNVCLVKHPYSDWSELEKSGA